MTRSTRKTWAARVRRWLESSLTAKEFASEIGVNPRTLIYWKWKLKKDREGALPAGRSELATSPAPRFVEVTSSMLPTSPALELVVGERVVIRVPSGFDPESLRRVLVVLEVRA